MEKRLIGSGCHLGGELGKLRDGLLDGVEVIEGERAVLEVNVGQPIMC